MGDCGRDLLGCCSAASPSQGAREDAAPCSRSSSRWSILAVPFLDTAFVVLKRMKYRRPGLRRPTSTTSTTASTGSASASAARCSTSTRWTIVRRRRSRSRCASSPTPTTTATSTPGWTIVMALLGAARAGGERLPRLRARDPQVPAPARDAAAPRAARRVTEREIDARRRAAARDRAVRRDPARGRRLRSAAGRQACRRRCAARSRPSRRRARRLATGCSCTSSW